MFHSQTLLRQHALYRVYDGLRLRFDLDVDGAPDVLPVEDRLPDGLRDEPHVESPGTRLSHRQRTPVHGYEPLGQDVLAPLRVQLKHNLAVVLGVLPPGSRSLIPHALLFYFVHH